MDLDGSALCHSKPRFSNFPDGCNTIVQLSVLDRKRFFMEAQFRQRKNIIIGRTSDGFKRFLCQSLSFDLDVPDRHRHV